MGRWVEVSSSISPKNNHNCPLWLIVVGVGLCLIVLCHKDSSVEHIIGHSNLLKMNQRTTTTIGSVYLYYPRYIIVNHPIDETHNIHQFLLQDFHDPSGGRRWPDIFSQCSSASVDSKSNKSSEVIIVHSSANGSSMLVCSCTHIIQLIVCCVIHDKRDKATKFFISTHKDGRLLRSKGVCRVKLYNMRYKIRKLNRNQFRFWN